MRRMGQRHPKARALSGSYFTNRPAAGFAPGRDTSPCSSEDRAPPSGGGRRRFESGQGHGVFPRTPPTGCAGNGPHPPDEACRRLGCDADDAGGLTERGAVWQRTRLGAGRSRVRIPPLRPGTHNPRGPVIWFSLHNTVPRRTPYPGRDVKAPVAQRTERHPPEVGVAGSSPAGGTSPHGRRPWGGTGMGDAPDAGRRRPFTVRGRKGSRPNRRGEGSLGKHNNNNQAILHVRHPRRTPQTGPLPHGA